MPTIKYDKKEYIVRNLSCKSLIKICFIPFSGNGINICRLWEMGQCPNDEEIKKLKLNKKTQ